MTTLAVAYLFALVLLVGGFAQGRGQIKGRLWVPVVLVWLVSGVGLAGGVLGGIR